MNRFIKLQGFGILMALALIVSACGGGGGGGDSAGASTNHTVTIANNGSNTTQLPSEQFTYMVITPTDHSSAAISASFVSSPETTISVDITIPKTTTYRVEIFTVQGGSSLSWSSIAMAVGGTTSCTISRNNMGYHDNTYMAGIQPD